MNHLHLLNRVSATHGYNICRSKCYRQSSGMRTSIFFLLSFCSGHLLPTVLGSEAASAALADVSLLCLDAERSGWRAAFCSNGSANHLEDNAGNGDSRLCWRAGPPSQEGTLIRPAAVHMAGSHWSLLAQAMSVLCPSRLIPSVRIHCSDWHFLL